MPTNFVLVSSAVIPLLALTLLVELRAFEPPASMSTGGRLGVLGAFLWIAGLTAYGEWVCLRSLELGHLAAGGTGAVWAAIANLGGFVVAQLVIRILLP